MLHTDEALLLQCTTSDILCPITLLLLELQYAKQAYLRIVNLNWNLNLEAQVEIDDASIRADPAWGRRLA